jgi:hypothetical protein
LVTSHSVTNTAAFRYVNNVGFCPVPRTYPMTTTSTISGLNNTACRLAQSGFGPPLPGLPADFATDLLAKLWSDGTLAVCDHPLGNIIEFHRTQSNPNDLGLPWRDCIACLNLTSRKNVYLICQSQSHQINSYYRVQYPCQSTLISLPIKKVQYSTG